MARFAAKKTTKIEKKKYGGKMDNEQKQFENPKEQLRLVELWPNLQEGERPTLIVLAGPGGGAEQVWLGYKHFGVDSGSDARCLFVEIDRVLAAELQEFGWAATLVGNFFKLPEMVEDINGKVDEVWMKNFKPMDKADKDMVKKIWDLLKPEGKLMFLEEMTGYSVEKRNELQKLFKDAGFRIEEVDVDNDEHPYVDYFRKIDMPSDDVEAIFRFRSKMTAWRLTKTEN